jgi:undecaprenyl-diphosphatase
VAERAGFRVREVRGCLFAALLVLGLWRSRSAGPGRLAAPVWAPLAVLAALAVNQPVGAAVGEGRPYDRLSGILVLVGRTTDVSFPSDHAVMAGAAAAGLWLVERRLGERAAAVNRASFWAVCSTCGCAATRH